MLYIWHLLKMEAASNSILKEASVNKDLACLQSFHTIRRTKGKNTSITHQVIGEVFCCFFITESDVGMAVCFSHWLLMKKSCWEILAHIEQHLVGKEKRSWKFMRYFYIVISYFPKDYYKDKPLSFEIINHILSFLFLTQFKKISIEMLFYILMMLQKLPPTCKATLRKMEERISRTTPYPLITI